MSRHGSNRFRPRTAVVRATVEGVAQGDGVRVVGPGAKPDHEQGRAIRRWARQQGWTVAAVGRIPAHVLAAYEQAHSREDTDGQH